MKRTVTEAFDSLFERDMEQIEKVEDVMKAIVIATAMVGAIALQWWG